MHKYLTAYQTHRVDAEKALALFRSYCDFPIPRVPGMDTAIRLAWRIANGRTVEEAAAREYAYRFKLAIKAGDQIGGVSDASVFGAPCLFGM